MKYIQKERDRQKILISLLSGKSVVEYFCKFDKANS